jgi:hypothetical protein
MFALVLVNGNTKRVSCSRIVEQPWPKINYYHNLIDVFSLLQTRIDSHSLSQDDVNAFARLMELIYLKEQLAEKERASRVKPVVYWYSRQG